MGREAGVSSLLPSKHGGSRTRETPRRGLCPGIALLLVKCLCHQPAATRAVHIAAYVCSEATLLPVQASQASYHHPMLLALLGTCLQAPGLLHSLGSRAGG